MTSKNQDQFVKWKKSEISLIPIICFYAWLPNTGSQALALISFKSKPTKLLCFDKQAIC